MLTRKSVIILNRRSATGFLHKSFKITIIPHLFSTTRTVHHLLCHFKPRSHLPQYQTSYRPTSNKHTLHSSFGTSSGDQTHGSRHEVRKDLVRPRGRLGRILAPAGDLQGRRVFLGATERAVERGLGRIRDISPLLAGREGGAGSRKLLSGASAQQGRGRGCERHGEVKRSACSNCRR